MTPRHIHFEFLCALAPSGQLLPDEQVELRDHVRHCASCAYSLAELVGLGGQILLAEVHEDCPSRTPSGALERFQARALREGIPLHPRPPRSLLTHTLGLASAVLIAALTIAATLPGRSILRGSFPIETSKRTDPFRATSPIANQESPSSTHAGPAAVRVQAQHARRFTRRNTQTAIASMESGTVSLPLPFESDRHARLNLAWHMPSYPRFPSAKYSQTPDALFAFTYPGSVAARSLDVAEFRRAGASEIAQLLEDSESGPFRNNNRSVFARPAFTLNARALGSSTQDLRSALDLNAYLPSAKLELKSRVPRFHLPQDAAE
jgi:hypothetical protein